MNDNILRVELKPEIFVSEWEGYGLAVLIKYPRRKFSDLYVIDDESGDTHEYKVYSIWLDPSPHFSRS